MVHAAMRQPRCQRKHRGHQRQQGDVARQGPVEAGALAIGEEAQRKEAEHDHRAGERQVAHARTRIAHAAPGRDHHRRQQQRRRKQQLHPAQPEAFTAELPGMAIHQLETQAGVGVVQVPQQQRQPCQRSDRDRRPRPATAQHGAALAHGQQGEQADCDHRDEAVMGESADHQTQRQFAGGEGIHATQQPQPGIQAQHARQQHRCIGQRKQRPACPPAAAAGPAIPHASAARVEFAHRRSATPATAAAAPTSRKGKRSRQHTCRVQSHHPRRSATRSGPGRSEYAHARMPAFLPVERFIHEQRQMRGQRTLEEHAIAHSAMNVRFAESVCCFNA
jgi:hypothetical protein